MRDRKIGPVWMFQMPKLRWRLVVYPDCPHVCLERHTDYNVPGPWHSVGRWPTACCACMRHLGDRCLIHDGRGKGYLI